MPYLDRTQFVLQTSKSHIDQISDADPDKPLIGVFMTFLVCISFYSEMELKLVDIVKAKLAVATDPKVVSLIMGARKCVLARLNKSDIADCAALFGLPVRDAFNAAVQESDVALYHNVITQRHSVAHSDNGQLVDWRVATLTMLDVENGIAAAERLIGAFEVSVQ